MVMLDFMFRARLLSIMKGYRSLGSRRKALIGSRRNFTAEAGSGNPFAEAVYEDSIKEKILESSLPYVSKHGWTTSAINDGAVSLGYPGVIHGVFSKPDIELIDYFNRKCNRELNFRLKASLLSSQGLADTRQFVHHTLKSRLQMVLPYIEHWPQALAIMGLPTNISLTFNTFSSLIDDVCYYSGDRSVDFNWYSRRAAVALIYQTTELFMIQDKSADYSQTWTFLERRIDEAFTVDKILQANQDAAQRMKEVTVASITTLGNILGLRFPANMVSKGREKPQMK